MAGMIHKYVFLSSVFVLICSMTASAQPVGSESPDLEGVPSLLPSTSTTTIPPLPTGSPTTPVDRRSLAKVAAYYYPWWGKDFHRGGTYPREFLSPPQEPELGEYDDTDPAVIAQHLTWSRQANIQVWIGAWWGPNKREDTTLLNVILPHSDLGDMEISLLYETRNRIPEVGDDTGVYSLDNVIPDMQHIAANYFDHPNYLRIGGRPVLFIYVSRWLNKRGLLGEVVNRMRSTAAAMGHDVFLVGDQVWRDAPTEPYGPFEWLDGVTNYDVYGNLQLQGDLYARDAKVNVYHSRQMDWRAACQGKCAFFPAAVPGFNNKGNKSPLSRQLDEQSAPGTLFQVMLDNAVSALDDAADRMLVVTSFNEHHEDTQIEPFVSTGDAATASLPTNITYGLTYEAYGEKYLDILLEATTEKL